MKRDDYPTKLRIYGYDGKASAVAEVFFEADGNVMAAAPDLLAACEAALKVIGPFDFAGTWEEATEPLKAAIAKAKGDT